MNLEEEINEFLNAFYNFHHKINNLLFDNLSMYYSIGIYLNKRLNHFFENNELEYSLNDFTKKSFYENLELIKKFYKEKNINFNLNKILSNGTLDYKELDLEEDNITYENIMFGLNGKLNKHKFVSLYNNGLITDSIILVHELSHFSNQTDEERGQVNNLLTEALAFTYELIYLDYLYNESYELDSINFRYMLMETFCGNLNRSYPLLTLYYLYDKTGNISKNNYQFIFNDTEDYDKILEEFYQFISINNDEIFNVLWYMLGSILSIYMYMNYKKNNKFFNNIKTLDSNLNNLNLEDALKIINLECIDNNFITNCNLDKIKESFEEFKIEFESLKTKCKKYHK